MNVVEMAHETQKTGFEFHNPKDRRWVHNTLWPAYRYHALNSPARKEEQVSGTFFNLAMFEFTMHLHNEMNRLLGVLAWGLIIPFNKKPLPSNRIHRQGLEIQFNLVVARARFCHYFTQPIRIPLVPEESNFSNKTKSFLKVPA